MVNELILIASVGGGSNSSGIGGNGASGIVVVITYF